MKQCVVLALVTGACLAPFLGKAFHIDDPLFLWAAEQIRREPLDFYGFAVNWDGYTWPMHEVMQNPPLVSYYLALASRVFGSSEVPLHLAMLLPAIGAIVATASLARALGTDPMLPALWVLATPVFLTSSSNVMCDTALLCFWTWSVTLWVTGLERSSSWRLAGGAGLIAVAALTKYFGIALAPLLLFFTLVKRRRLTPELLWLLVPATLLAGYQFWTQRLYGHGLLFQAASYAQSVRYGLPGSSWLKLIGVFCFTGGGTLPVVGYLPWLVGRRWLIAAGVTATVAIALLVASRPAWVVAFHVANRFPWETALQMGLFGTLGLVVVGVAVSELVRRRDAETCLLVLWMTGTLVFAGFVNWTVNGRSLLPMLPAWGILWTRRLEALPKAPLYLRDGRRFWPLVPALAVGMAVAWSDWQLAASARSAAMTIVTAPRDPNATLWFQGHWGFQYYMERAGAKAVEFDRLALDPGDLVVLPMHNPNVREFPQGLTRPLQRLQLPVLSWLATMRVEVGAGFYSDVFGPLPFAFGRIPPEEYRVESVVIPIRSE